MYRHTAHHLLSPLLPPYHTNVSRRSRSHPSRDRGCRLGNLDRPARDICCKSFGDSSGRIYWEQLQRTKPSASRPPVLRDQAQEELLLWERRRPDLLGTMDTGYCLRKTKNRDRHVPHISVHGCSSLTGSRESEGPPSHGNKLTESGNENC